VTGRSAQGAVSRPFGARRWTDWRLLAILLVVGAVLAAVLILGNPAPANADLVCKPASTPRATVLLFHPGGFVEGNGRDFKSECHEFAADGYLAVSIDYSHKLQPAIRDAHERARSLGATAHREHRSIFAYGLSAGGAFAARLANHGEVDAAFVYAGVYDIAGWVGTNTKLQKAMGVTKAQMVSLSPINEPIDHPSPLLVAHNPHDIVAPYKVAVRMARRSPQYHLRTYRHPTNGYAAHIAHPVSPALSFFQRHMSRSH
jgi:acetyl esterase/lipase